MKKINFLEYKWEVSRGYVPNFIVHYTSDENFLKLKTRYLFNLPNNQVCIFRPPLSYGYVELQIADYPEVAVLLKLLK